MDEAATVTEQLSDIFRNLVQSVVQAVPKVVVGLILLLVALAVAKLIEVVLRGILRRVRFDSLLGRAGLDQTLARLGLRQEMSQVLPRIVYFLALFLFARAAADGLGLTAVSEAIGTFLGYVPNLLAGALVLVLGSTAAQVASRAIASAAENAGIEYGASLGRVVSAMILFVAGIMALGQLQVETDIIRLVTACGLAGLALAFALSFGLGTREISRNIIAGFYARKVFRIGEEMEVSGVRGTLTAITPTQILLDTEGRTVSVSNAAFLDQVVKQ